MEAVVPLAVEYVVDAAFSAEVHEYVIHPAVTDYVVGLESEHLAPGKLIVEVGTEPVKLAEPAHLVEPMLPHVAQRVVMHLDRKAQQPGQRVHGLYGVMVVAHPNVVHRVALFFQPFL